MRIFELLKDLPDCPAKEIYKQTEDGEHYVCYNNMGKWSVAYTKEIVENSPSWFKEIKDTEQSSKPLVWTDELVSEFAIYWRGKGGSSKYAIEAFKHSKSIPAGKGTANDVLNDDTFKIVFSRTDSWKKNIDILKNAMLKEGYGLANIPPNEKPPKQNSEGKDWEIVAYKHGDQIYDVGLKHGKFWFESWFKHHQYDIHSVKRLSDGEVFSVGEYRFVDYSMPGTGKLYYLIEGFKIKDDKMYAVINHSCWAELSWLASFQKDKSQSKHESKRRIEVYVQILDQAGSVVFIRPMRSDDKIPVHKANQIKIAVETIINS